jgi:hypothetical protein
MNTNEEVAVAKKIAGALDVGSANLKQGIAYRLQTARQQALAQLGEAQTAMEPELALAGNRGASFGGRNALSGVRFWLPPLLIVAAIASYQSLQYWQSVQSQKDIEETDAAILTSDLPIDAYLDRGFNNWLKHSDE